MHSVANIIQLRQLLAERFPNVRMAIGPNKSTRWWSTGIAQLDGRLEGGLPKSALTELVSPNPSSGSAVVLHAVLREAARHRQWIGLIDGQDSFDPTRFENSELSRLLWVRCDNASQAVKAADFVLRDGNLAVVILDLRQNSSRQLQKIPSSSWYRLQRCLESGATALLVVTPRPMVGAAHARLRLQNGFSLRALSQPNDELVAALQFELLRIHGMDHEHRELIAQAG